MKQVRVPGIQAGVLDRQRGPCPYSTDHSECVCACESREYHVCTFTSDLSLPAEEEDRNLAAYVLCKSYM